MKTLRIVTFLIIYVIITFLWLLYDRRNIFDKNVINDILHLPAIWVFPILMMVVGLALSVLYSYFKKTTNKCFIFGQLTCTVITLLLFIYTFISDRQHERQFGNFDYNRANRDNTFFPTDTAYQAKTYDALESNFSDKNSFRLVEILNGNVDTTINSQKTKIFVSWFKYYLVERPTNLLCAKYYVLNDTVINEYVNSDLQENLNFRFHSPYLDSLLKVAEQVK